MSIPGIGINQRGKKRDHLAEAKITAQIVNPTGRNQTIILENVPMPRKPRKDNGIVRGHSNQPERELRLDVLKYLRKKGARVWRIENAIVVKRGRGLPDLCFFRNSFFYFCELKSETGTLRLEQREFKLLCEEAGIRHLVIRCVNDFKQAGII